MAVEYTAWIAEEDYDAFREMLVPIMPDSYALWLRVRERGKQLSTLNDSHDLAQRHPPFAKEKTG